MKTILTYSLLFIALVNMGCGEDANPEQSTPTPVSVTVETVTDQGGEATFSITGRVVSVNQANLGTRIMGYVNQLEVKTGDRVQAGQVLIRLDNADLQAKLAQVNAGIAEAEAAYTNASKDYQRFQSLFADQSASQKEMDDITTRYRMAQSRLEGARQMAKEVQAQFAYTRITAPFNGVVTNTFAKAGDLVNPGQPLVAVEAPGSFEIKAQVPENRIHQVQIGDTAEVWIKSLDARVSGTVSELSTSAQNTGGQYEITLLIKEQNSNLRSGMYAAVILSGTEEATQKSTKLLIPAEALVSRGDLKGVYTVSQNNTAVLRWLRLGQTYEDQVEVLSGLKAGESFVKAADSKLYNGAPIRLQ
jgi:RND family efflux transporter MFP subunit